MDPLHSSDAISEGKLDLVPMIDCVMLLLLFFILTTRFASEELRLSSLLSTTHGPSQALDVVTPLQDLHIVIYPAGLERGLQQAEYEQEVRELSLRTHGLRQAWLRIGKQPPMAIEVGGLREKGGAAGRELAQIEAYITAALERSERPGSDRLHQQPVIIDCYSGLPWNCALTVYDSVRSYEIQHGATQPADGAMRDPLDTARPVEFAPARVRDSSMHERGDELFELVNHCG
jgi:hypothetical protein